MKRTVNFEGVKARVRNFNFKIFSIAFLAITAFVLNACTGASTSSTPLGGNVDVNETAATVNGKVIKLQEVERVIKQQGGGQEGKLSPLELAKARLEVLESLIQQEVMFQKAEKEKQVPTDEEVTAELNKRKTASGISQEEFDKKMKEAGETDASIRETIKRGLAIQKLTEKITNKIEPPKDSEIDAFYVGNKEAFVKKKGVKIAAIVIDPKVIGEGDTTTNEQEAVLKAKELFAKVQQPASDFAAIARENSEDQSRLQGGDLGYLSQEELSQGFSPQLAAGLMDPRFPVGQVTGAQAQGKYFIIKLQERSDKDENLTLESPGIRQQVTDSLINARKQLLAASFQSLAMDEAKIENYLARKVVENPNELSGARPAGAATTPTPANTDANTANTNANVSANSNANTKTNANANANANTKANTNSNTK